MKFEVEFQLELCTYICKNNNNCHPFLLETRGGAPLGLSIGIGGKKLVNS
jgi:hypothetical protein